MTEGVTRGGCRWRRGRCGAEDTDRLDAAAWLVADEIIKLRCGPATGIYDLWRLIAKRGTVPDGADPTTVEPFVAPTFGLPSDPGSTEHVQGYVAEIAWRMLTEEASDVGRSIEYLAVPDSDVISPGGDGFVVYRLDARAALAFRLWEIKKRSGSGTVSGTIGNAYGQLNLNAERYLAKITGQSQVPQENTELREFFADLVPAWKRSDEAAGAGVAVAANAEGLPDRAFTTMHKHFPAFVAAGGIEGLLIGLGGLKDFSTHVRTLLWTGLSVATT